MLSGVLYFMRVQEFSSLTYKDQLKLINHSGKLKQSLIVDDYQFTLYKINDFYVELKRSIHELFFEKITAMYYDDLPEQYKNLRVAHRNFGL